MKKYGILICAAALLLTSCGGGSSAVAENSSAPADSAAPAAELKDEPAASEQDAPAENADALTFDFRGVILTLPAGYTEDESADSVIAESGSSPKLWYSHQIRVFYDMADGAVQNFTYQDVPNLMWEKLNESVNDVFPADPETTVKTVEQTSDAKFLDFQAVREQGTLKTDRGGEQHTLQYTAYFSKCDFEAYGDKDAPCMWIAFSEEGGADAVGALADSVIASAKKS